MSTKYVYSFGAGKADGSAEMKNLLGGKGANLAEMTTLGIPVPPGFTITTEVCTHYVTHDGKYPPQLRESVQQAMAAVEKIMERRFGSTDDPAVGFGSVGCTDVHAGDDGYGAQSRAERSDRSRAHQAQQRTIRVRQLSPICHDVR